MQRIEAKVAKPPRGRPPKYSAKRITITVRLQEPIYQQVAVSADAHGRSISEEFEQRINRSFEDDAAFPDPELRQLAIRLITRFLDAGRLTDMKRSGTVRSVNTWLNDPDSYESGMLAAIEHLAVASPEMSSIQVWDYITWMRSLQNSYTPQRFREILKKLSHYANTSAKATKLK
jgi:hypothetical protein